MVQTGFAGAVCKRFKRRNAEAIDTSDIDNTGWVFGRSRFL